LSGAILVADDDPASADLVFYFLRSQGLGFCASGTWRARSR
jgi:hypothetical protein